MVATKAALSIRLDALADADSKSSLDSATIGLENRAKLETRLRLLEQGMGHTSLRSIAEAAGGTPGTSKFEMQGNGARYNDAADTLVPTAVAVAVVKMDEDEEVVGEEAQRKAAKKAKKEAKRLAEAAVVEAVGGEDVVEDDEVRYDTRPSSPFCEADPRSPQAAKKEKKRLKKLAKAAAAEATEDGTPTKAKKEKKDKKRSREADGDEAASKKVKA